MGVSQSHNKEAGFSPKKKGLMLEEFRGHSHPPSGKWHLGRGHLVRVSLLLVSFDGNYICVCVCERERERGRENFNYSKTRAKPGGMASTASPKNIVMHVFLFFPVDR